MSTGLPPDPAIVSVSGRSTLPSQAAPSLLGHSSQLNQSVPFGAFHTAVGSPLLGGKNRGNGGFRLGPMSRGEIGIFRSAKNQHETRIFKIKRF